MGAIALAFVEGSGFNTPVMAGVHGVLATLLIFRTWKLNAAGWVGRAGQGCQNLWVGGSLAGDEGSVWAGLGSVRSNSSSTLQFCEASGWGSGGCGVQLKFCPLHVCRYSKEAILSFYRWIWNLFYSTYAAFPFI